MFLHFSLKKDAVPGLRIETRIRWRGQSQEDVYRTEVRFKDKNLLKIKVFASSGSHRVRIRGLQIRDSDPDQNPDPG
jgi:hypothetical protein